MLAGIGSATIAASACSAHGGAQRLLVVPGDHDGVGGRARPVTPGLAGRRLVARPEPASASSPSTWPW